jgi:hypothetical protein
VSRVRKGWLAHWFSIQIVASPLMRVPDSETGDDPEKIAKQPRLHVLS